MSRISVEQKKRLLLDQKQLVSTERNRVNDRKRLIARKQSTEPRNFCMVSKKMKRIKQHNPLSPLPVFKKTKKRKRGLFKVS